jgi:hypothetical protein
MSAEQVRGTTPQNNTSAKGISLKQHLHLPAGATLWERRGIRTKAAVMDRRLSYTSALWLNIGLDQTRRLKDNQNSRRR